MKDPYPPTDISPQGPFPEGTRFYMDDTHDLFVLLPKQGLYEVVDGTLSPTDRVDREGFMNNFFSSGTELFRENYFDELKERESRK